MQDTFTHNSAAATDVSSIRMECASYRMTPPHLQRLLHHAAAIHLQAQGQDIAFQHASQLQALSRSAVLQEFLAGGGKRGQEKGKYHKTDERHHKTGTLC